MMGLYGIILYASVLQALGEAGDRKLIRPTKYGRVRGIQTDLAQVFYGTPYAAPAPRWSSPVDPSPWRGTYDASTPKPMCYQPGSCSQELPIDCIPMKSEDCLYLNIFAPLDTQKTSKKAVIFFMHGGSYEYGTGAALVYNAEMMANKGDVIVVNFNYRLGAFGFLVTGDLADDLTGNYGLKDQQLALKWVNENIRNFGGDSRKITISGQSAGGYSTAIFLSSGKVDDLFSRAILQSAPFALPLKTQFAAIEQGVAFAGLAQCLHNGYANTTCLKSMSADEIVTIQGQLDGFVFSDSVVRSFMPWLPHIDGDEVKTGLIEGFRNTSIPLKSVILGTVTDEGLSYTMRTFEDPVPFFAVPIIINIFVPNAPANILNSYPIDNPRDAREELSVMTTDYMFSCPGRLIARELSNRMPVYVYTFDQPVDFPEAWVYDPYCIGRVCHGSDLPFVFQSARIEPYVFDEDDIALSDKIVSYWSSFAKYGTPNRGLVNGTEWLRYSKHGQNKESTIVFRADDLSQEQEYRSEFCDAWDLSGYQ